jgi:DNA-binding CsgD family transcriptional regulator
MSLGTRRWKNLGEATRAFRRIRNDYLTEDELILLDLRMLGKSDGHIATVLGISRMAVNKRRHRLDQRINFYAWWLQNEKKVTRSVIKRMSKSHLVVLLSVIKRIPQPEIAKRTGLGRWSVYRQRAQCREFLRKAPDSGIIFEQLRRGRE